MNSSHKYKTKQKELLLQYFESRPGVHITAGEVCSYFKEQGALIGQSTIYRQLEHLVDEQILKKYVIDANSPACFEYLPDHTHCDTDTCFHCKCEKCGKLIHLQCDEVEKLQKHMLEKHHFQLDPVRTVFYGRCEDCI